MNYAFRTTSILIWSTVYLNISAPHLKLVIGPLEQSLLNMMCIFTTLADLKDNQSNQELRWGIVS